MGELYPSFQFLFCVEAIGVKNKQFVSNLTWTKQNNMCSFLKVKVFHNVVNNLKSRIDFEMEAGYCGCTICALGDLSTAYITQT
jgi:hypothetical protein